MPIATEKKIAANRRNALRSTGPRTRKGKAVSRLNALRHGLRSSGSILPPEKWRELLQYRDRFLQACQPQTVEERRRIAEVACAEWKLLYWQEIRLELRRITADAPCVSHQRRLARLDRAIRLAHQQLDQLGRANPPASPPAA